MELHVELVDGEGDAAARRCGDVPDTLPVFWIPVGVVRAVEGTAGAGELLATTCRSEGTKVLTCCIHINKSVHSRL